MRHVPRIFVDAPLSEGAQVALSGDTAHHLLNVLRVTAGAALVVFNGKGGEYQASVTRAAKRELTLQVGRHQPVRRESPLRITLAQAVSRSERMDYSIQKAVELGVAAIQPVLSEYSLHLDGERADKKLAHWRAIAQSAAEQSGREYVPAVQSAVALADYCRGDSTSSLRLVLHPGGASLKSLAKPVEATLLVGPEGGLSDKDLQVAAGFQSVSLGPRILRTETAGMAALATMQGLWGDLT